MALSIKKIFEKKDSEAKAEVTEEQRTAETSNTDSGAEKPAKHDTPSGCCGSCS
ncbi:CCGSCS motif protein [Vibrio kasasachensis]|uniref:CCGSCS motif protein n=1 Tax=Vibrio kasasachensis TaxID=2910248 RepID=UPI003D106708